MCPRACVADSLGGAMATDQQPDDPRSFERNRPTNIGALANEVITVLRDRQSSTRAGVRGFALEHLTRAILTRGHFDASALLDQLRGYRLTTDAIIDVYVPVAAARLGEEWEADGLSFADVTIGALRLQTLLGEASLQHVTALTPSKAHLHTMVLVPRGEQHFLGASVLSAQLRRIGCDVVLSYDETRGMLGARLMVEDPGLILITCGSDETVESAAETVQTIKTTLSDPPPIILGGAVVAEDDIKKKTKLKKITGVDIVTNCTAEAVALAANGKRAARHS